MTDLKEEILKEMSIGMFGALASETPDPYVTEVDEEYNQVEGETPDGETAEGNVNRKSIQRAVNRAIKARNFLNSPIEGNAETDGERTTFTPPFTKEEAEYMEQGSEDFDDEHKNCQSCAFYVEGGGCLMVQGEIDPEDYCTQLFSDVAISGHSHGGEGEEEVAEEVTIYGNKYDWDEVDIEEYAESVRQILQDREGMGKSNISKNRIYVESPEEVPEGFEVQEGSQGGIYYETDEAEADFTQEEWEQAGVQILEDFDEDDYEWDYWTDSYPEPEEVEPGSIVHLSDDMWVAGGETDGPRGVVVESDPEAGEFAVVTEDGEMMLAEDFESLLNGEAELGITSMWDAPDQDNIRVGWDDDAQEEEGEPEPEEEEESPEWENREVGFNDIEEGDTIVVRDTDTGEVSTIEITDRGDGFVEGRSHRGTAAGVRESELQGDVVDDPDKEILGRVDNPSVHSPVEREQIQETLSQYEDEIEAITDEFPYNIHEGEGVEEVPEVQSGGDFNRLDEETAGKIRGAIAEQVGDKEAVSSVWNAMQSMKQDSSMSAGAYTDALAKETFGLDGDTRPSEEEISISDEEKKAYALYTAASQEAMRKMQGAEFKTHRGLREHGAKSLVKGWLEDPMATDYRVEENASANHTVTEGIAKSFGSSQLRISQESTPEDILNANDLVRGNYKASPGAHEGEVWRPGGEQAVHAWEITLGSYIEGDGAFGESKELTLGDFQKPVDELEEPMLRNMGKHVQKLDEEDALSGEAAENLRAFAERYEEVMDDDKMHEVADRAIADAKRDESPVIDLTYPTEADWLGEGREEQDEEGDTKSDIAAALMNTTSTFLKARRYVSSPEEVPEGFEPQEGPQGGTYYETEGTSEGQSRLGPHDSDSESQEDEGIEDIPDFYDAEFNDYVEDFIEQQGIESLEVPERPDHDDVRDAKEVWEDAKDYASEVIDEVDDPQTAFEVVSFASNRLDEMRSRRNESTGSSTDAPSTPDPISEEELEEYDGEIPQDIPDEMEPMFAIADMSESYRQFRETVNQNGMMDISNRKVHRFGRALSGDPEYELPDLETMSEEDLGGIADYDPQTAANIRDAQEDGEITMYRAVPKFVDEVGVGDYVALNRDYVERHGENVLGSQQDEAWEILEEEVPLEDVAWPGEDAEEFVYSPKEIRERWPSTKHFYEDVSGENGEKSAVRNALRMALDKKRVYVEDASQAPDDANVQEGPNGGLYYETGSTDSGESEEEPDEDASDGEVSEGMHHMRIGVADRHPEMVSTAMHLNQKFGPKLTNSFMRHAADVLDYVDPETVNTVATLFLSDDANTDIGFGLEEAKRGKKLSERMVRAVPQVKGRRYVDSPDEVPEGYDVQEGPQGGLYYEVEDEEYEEEGVGEGWVSLDEVSLQNVDYLLDENGEIWEIEDVDHMDGIGATVRATNEEGEIQDFFPDHDDDIVAAYDGEDVPGDGESEWVPHVNEQGERGYMNTLTGEFREGAKDPPEDIHGEEVSEENPLQEGDFVRLEYDDEVHYGFVYTDRGNGQMLVIDDRSRWDVPKEGFSEGDQLHGTMEVERIGQPEDKTVDPQEVEIDSADDAEYVLNELPNEGVVRVADALKTGSLSIDELRDAAEETWGLLSMGKQLMELGGTGSSDYGQISLKTGLGGKGDEDKLRSGFEEEHGEDTYTNVSRAARGWEQGMYKDRKTAPLIQYAMQKTQNDSLPEYQHSDVASEADVSEEDIKDMEAISEYTTERLREAFGDEVTVFRGFAENPHSGTPSEGTEVVDKMRQAKENDEEVQIEHRPVESWSFNPEVASLYGAGGAIVKQTIPVERIAMSSSVGFPDEGEEDTVVMHEGPQTYDPDQIILDDETSDEEMKFQLNAEAVEETG